MNNSQQEDAAAQRLREEAGRTSIGTKISESLNNLVNSGSSLFGRTKVLQALGKIKPFVLARLIRNLIDAPNYEHFLFSVISLLDLYSEHLPSYDDISPDAFKEAWRFLQFTKTQDPEVFVDAREQVQEDEFFPQARFVRKDKANPEFERLCKTFGLTPDATEERFKAMEIPLVVVSGLMAIAAIFMGDRIAGLLIDQKIFERNLSKCARVIKDTQVIWTAFDKTWEAILDFVGSMFGFTYVPERDAKIDAIMNKIIHLRNHFNEVNTKMREGLSGLIQSEVGIPNLVKELSALETECDKLTRAGVKGIDFYHYIGQFRKQLEVSKEIIAKVRASTIGKQEPTVLYLYGNSRLGKSHFAEHFVELLSKREGRNLSVYTRNAVQDVFWSTYMHQDVVIFDDFGQDQKDLDHSDMFGCKTPADYKLNMADTPEKGMPFTSRYIIACSNFDYFTTSKAIKDTSALNGRRDLFCHVYGPEIEAYREIHGVVPPPDSELWRPDFSHLHFDKWCPSLQSGRGDWDEFKVQEVGIRPETMADFIYKRQLLYAKIHEDKLERLNRSNDFRALLQNMQFDDGLFREIELENNLRARAFELERDERQEMIDLMNNDIFYDAIDVDGLQPQSIVHEAVGSNLYLLQGPSGCGKSHLLSDLICKKINHVSEIYDVQTGELKIAPQANLHIEDASITVARTNDALDIIQRLYDDPKFLGTCIVSANPGMLQQNLAARGPEAIEVMYRRCKVVNIQKRWNTSTLLCGLTAKDLAHRTDIDWNTLYFAEYEGRKMNLIDTKLFLTKNERTIRTYATFDREALADFDESKAVLLEFPSVPWDVFSCMEDYSQLAGALTARSIIRASMNLGNYTRVLSSLPKQYSSPLELVEIINRQQMRVPEKTPSAILKFADFTIKLINHKTYVMMQINTVDFDIPDVTWTNPMMRECPERKAIWQMVVEFFALLAGGSLIVRELTGMNQWGKKENTPTEVKPVVCCHLAGESKASNRRKAKNKEKIVAQKVSRASLPTKERADPSPGNTEDRSEHKGELFNEAIAVLRDHFDGEAKNIVGYDFNQKAETKVLTHTDIEPRFDIPDYDNHLDITPLSLYHPSNYPFIKRLYNEKMPMDKLFQQFERYLIDNKLETNFFIENLTFANLDPREEAFWYMFINMYRQHHLSPESIADPMAASLIPILQRNQVFMVEGGLVKCRALMIQGRLGITVAHCVTPYTQIQIPSTGQEFKITILETNTDRDYCIFEVVKQCQSFQTILHFIRSVKDTQLLDGCDAYQLTVHKNKHDIVSLIKATKIMTCKEVEYNKVKHFGILYAGTVRGFEIQLPSMTQTGDCGSPTVVLNTRYARKIISIHAAGNDSSAFGIPIYREWFEGKFFKSEAHNLTPITVLPHQQLVEIEPFKDGEFTIRYETVHKQSHPTKTNIFRSPLQCDMFGDNFQPSILADYDTRNVDNVSIKSVTLDKWNRTQESNLDLNLLDEVVDEIADYYKQITRNSGKKQFVLSKTEAINRTTYYKSSQPLPLDTSAGYPWKHRKGAVGKKLFIKPFQRSDGIILNGIARDQNGQDLHHAIDSLIQTCREGKRPAVVFSSSAKDEVLKKSKIYPCRTRGFAGAPLDYSIAHRMYFHTAMCTLMETREEHPIKVGIDASSLEWDKLYRYLADCSTIGFDTDFKDWDASILKEVMARLHRIYNAIYSADEDWSRLNGHPLDEENFVRKMLHSVLWGPLITSGDYVIESPGGQVSGQNGTTIDNCLINFIQARYTWKKKAPPNLKDWNSFMKKTRFMCFGDDNGMAVHPSVVEWFNLSTIIEVAKSDFNMDATAASKGETTENWKPIEEIEFLKRNFIKIGPYHYGKLQPSVFDKMLNWTHTFRKHHAFRELDKVHFELATIESTVESMALELSLYEPSIYNKVRDHVNHKLNQIGSRCLMLTQNAALEKRGIPHDLFHASFKQDS